MAICIHIIKCGEMENNKHVYHVCDIGKDSCEFYVVISADEKTISLYMDQELKSLLRVFDIKNPDEKLSVPELDHRVVGRVMMRCLRALRDNHFPRSISYEA